MNSLQCFYDCLTVKKVLVKPLEPQVAPIARQRFVNAHVIKLWLCFCFQENVKII